MADPLHPPKIVEKPWGREIWFADQPAYAGKLLEVRKGCRLSLQYHERKIETLYLLSGRVRLTYRATAPGETPTVAVAPADQFEWLPGRALHVPPRTVHRFEALEDSVLIESSTPDLTDIVRLQDDFSRPARD
ncbi:MAG: cupin [Opitutales bacterium]|jgi:quercetin dioxygenase-like cupin family protein